MSEADADAQRRGRKSPGAYRTISEVADELHVPQHVLRFWETKFPQIRPLKRGGGRRYYRPEDILLLRRISDLLYIQGYTIKGVQRLLREGGGEAVEAAEADGGELADAPEPDDVPDPAPTAPQLPLPGMPAAATPAVAKPVVRVRAESSASPARPSAATDPFPGADEALADAVEDGAALAAAEAEILRLRALLAEAARELQAVRRLLAEAVAPP
jgi:DNA-binding transcriptional MerR regulator